MPKPKSKKIKTPKERAEELGRRLSDAICGWLIFQQAARRNRAYNEHLTYLPLFEVSDGRKWRVFPQFGFRAPLDGHRYSIDFLLFQERYRVFVLVEIKFQKHSGAQIKAFTPDVEKMMHVDHAIIAACFPDLKTYCKPSVPIRRLMMCIGQGGALERLWRLERESENLRKQAKQILKASDQKNNLVQTNHAGGCLRISPALVGRDFRVMTLYEQDWWSDLILSQAKRFKH